MRARNIKPGFFRDEQLIQVPPLGRLLFAGLWCLADREGRLLDRPAQIKWDVLPADDCDINALLAELATRGFIRRYAVNGTRYIEVTRFLAHQNPHHKEKASLIPPPPDTTPAQKHDSTLLIPDSLIPDSLIPDSVSQLVGDKSIASTALSETKAVDKTGKPSRSAATKLPSSAKKEKTTDDKHPTSVRNVHETDRKANIFLSRQDGNTNRITSCKQVKHETNWVEGFFAE